MKSGPQGPGVDFAHPAQQTPAMTRAPTFADIRIAHGRIALHIHRTPILTSRLIDAMLGTNILFKCENLQRTGAFKARGAMNAVLALDEAEAANGVATQSSGNHAAALALAAHIRGIPCFAVMPRTAPSVKKAAVAAYGATIVECEPTLAAREAAAALIVAETGAAYIAPFDNTDVAAGQGTAAIELIEDAGIHLDSILCPVGGGGLLAGTAVAVRGIAPETRIIGTEPALAADAAEGFRLRVRQPQILPIATIADGLGASMSDMTFGAMCEWADDVVTVSEEAIIAAMRLIWTRLKIVVEPSGAVPLAAILEGKVKVEGQSVGIILTGGNVDIDQLPW